ncbi:M20 family metallo-hydrolase [uncultured Clostridium sp.]|uniref:M20 family metallo-hydrolase n=1 Tax=uncultured Clostridium sp. TaxID=59620 RepID=UPI0025D3305F|nr:M20 family metallo-hydrolase [uncultured Clostridium sp.]
MKDFFINKDRVKRRLKELAEFGMNEYGGIDRSIGSDSDVEARKFLIDILKNQIGAYVKIDPIANIFAEVKGNENLKPITLGSHHDAVPNGGKFDGALGVLLAIEVVQRITEEKIKMRHPLQIVSFSAEEPNPYNISTLGSRVATGKVSKEQVKKAKNKDDGTMLSQALKRIGGNADVLEDALLKKNDMSAFIECHIEQGRILFDKKESVGVVKKITGIYREEIRVLGEANHAGTTLMKYRHDSFLSTAEAALKLERIVKEVNREDVVGTVGRVNVFPNSANIISGDVEFIIEIRTPNNEIKEEIIRKFTLSLKDIEEKRNVKFERKVILNQAEVNMDKDIINALKSSIEELGMPVIDMVSMAGHDSVHMCDITKTGMLFVQSIDGKSHCKEENTDMKDIERAGNVLLNTVLKLDKEVD